MNLPNDAMSGTEQIVRCNHCMAMFTESEIAIKDDVEYCPECGAAGALMDMESASSERRAGLKNRPTKPRMAEPE